MGKNDNKVRMIGPDGSIALIPASRMEDAIKMGARVEPKKEAHPIAALAGGFGSGVAGSLPDIAASIYNIPASAMNIAREHAIKNPETYSGFGGDIFPVSPGQAELPLIPSATESLHKGVENVIGETPEGYKHLVEGSKLAGSIASPGGAAKAALKVGSKGVSKGLGYLGSLNPSNIAGGALAGTTMSKLGEEGYSPLTQVAAGIGSGSLPSMAGTLSRGSLELAKKGTFGAIGLSPKQLNLKSAKAAKESGVDLPSSAFTENKFMGLIDQYLGKSPIFGDKLRDKYLKGEKQTLDRLNSIYDEVGPLKTKEIESKINKFYKQASESLPENASIPPTHTVQTIDEILSKLNKSLSPSEDQVYVIKKLNDIKEGILNHSKHILPDLSKEELKWLKNNGLEDASKLGKIKNEYPIMNLWETKKSLNDTINWNIKDNNYKNLLKNVQHSILEDIGQYGKKDPAWYNNFKSADELFGKVSKRKRLEHLLSERPINAATGNYSYNSLSKIIHSPDTSRELKSLTSSGTFEKIEKLGDVARTMSIKSKNIPNPSGTAMVAGIGSLLGGLFTYPLPTTIGVVGLGGLTKLLTDNRFLDLAIKTAEGTKNTKDILNMRRKVKELTGLSINTINRKMNREENMKEGGEFQNVKMIGPDGSIAFIPSNKVKDALTLGAKMVNTP